MKNFIKACNWKKFLRLETWCFGIITFLYIVSLIDETNKFPKNILIIPLGMFLWGIILILKTIPEYLNQKYKKERENETIYDKHFGDTFYDDHY